MQVIRFAFFVALLSTITSLGSVPETRIEPEPTLETLNNAGRRHYEDGRYDEAAEAFLIMIALGDTRAATQNDAGHSLWRAGHAEMALPHLQMAARHSPKNTRYSNNLATVLVDLGRDADALAVMQRAHTVSEHAHFNMAYLYRKRNRNQEAIEHLEKAIELNNDFARARELLEKISSLDTTEGR